MPLPIAPSNPIRPADHSDRPNGTPRLSRPVSETAVDPHLKTACDEMEALFIHHMLSEMRKTVTKSGLSDGGRAEEIYTSLMDAELAKKMAAAGGLGLARMLQEQMSGHGAVLPKKRSGR